MEKTKTGHSRTGTKGPVAQRTPQRSRTLMRQAVRRPVKAKRRIKAHGLVHPPSDLMVIPSGDNKLKSGRYSMLNHVKKSDRISHFASFTPSPAVTTLDTAPIKPVEEEIPSSFIVSPKTAEGNTKLSTDELWERALIQATSHLEPPPKTGKPKRRVLKRVLSHR